MILWLVSALASGACVKASNSDDVVRHLLEAEAAYEALEVERFTDAVDKATLVLGCLEAPIQVELAAWVHRTMGLRMFGTDPAKSAAAMGAAKALDPRFALPASLVPAGHPAREFYDNAVVTADITPVGRPLHGYAVFFDGTPLKKGRPTDRASIVQVQGSSGVMEVTQYTFPADSLPRYPADEVKERTGSDPRIGIGIASGLAVVGSGVLFAAAGTQKSRFTNAPLGPDPVENESALQGYAGRANMLSAAALGAGVLGLAGGVTVAVAF